MEQATFTDVSCIEDFYLFYFIENQVCKLLVFSFFYWHTRVLKMIKLEAVMQKVEEFREIAKEVVSNACYGALLAKGFIVDETQEPGLCLS